jgi:hypothetical protein
MTNILQLPQFSSSSAFAITNNADWRDGIGFGIDITGITFVANMRAEVTGSEVFLNMTTDNGLLINGGIVGSLSFLVMASQMALIDPGTYVMDIVATGDGATVNLFPEGPATVTVSEGVTR